MICRQLSLVKHTPLWDCALPLYCKSWQCEICAPRRAYQLVKTGIAGRPERLLTLTASKATAQTPAARAVAISHAWRKIVREIRKLWPSQPLEYLAVFERTQHLEPHLHVLTRGPFIPQKWLSAQAAKRLRAPIVDVRAIRNPERAAKYIAKYIGKDPYKFDGCKRYWQTPNWTPPNQTRASGEFADVKWQRGDDTIWQLAHKWYRSTPETLLFCDKELIARGFIPSDLRARVKLMRRGVEDVLPNGVGQ